jgi:hypothetical protein
MRRRPGAAMLPATILENRSATVNTAVHSPSPSPAMRTHYELRFESLFNPGRGLAFPCDAGGRVEMDTLSDAALRNYLYARAVVGREFATPAVVLS